MWVECEWDVTGCARVAEYASFSPPPSCIVVRAVAWRYDRGGVARRGLVDVEHTHIVGSECYTYLFDIQVCCVKIRYNYSNSYVALLCACLSRGLAVYMILRLVMLSVDISLSSFAVTAGIVWHCRTIAYITANIIYFIYCIPNYVITGELKSKSLSCV